jgi:glycosyltransferase involved in cell wall biosynthesis
MYKPTISVVVPTFNSADTIRDCLESLLNQAIGPYEVIVVDGGSTDDTAKIASGCRGAVVLRNHHSHFPGSSRNLGGEVARGNVVLFLDSDCRADKMLLAHHRRCYSAPGRIDGVQGVLRSQNRDEASRILESQFLTQYWLDNLNQDGTIKFHSAAVSNLSIRREFFLKNKFSEDLASCDDVELFIKLRRANARVLLEPRAVAYHPHPTNLHDIFEQRKWYGEGFVDLHGKYPRFRFRRNSMFDTSRRYLHVSSRTLKNMVYQDHRTLCEDCTLQTCKIADKKLRAKRQINPRYLRQVTCLGFAAGILRKRFDADYEWH